MSLEESDWENLILSIRKKDCLPILGAGTSASFLPLAKDFAKNLAKEYDLPFKEDCDNLSKVAQWLAIKKRDEMFPKLQICKMIAKATLPNFTRSKDAPHAILSKLDLPVYITTNYRNHKPSFKSSLLRIPRTINSKNNSEVKIIQRYDINQIPSIDNNQLLREFRLYLADIDIRKKSIAKKETNKNRESVTVKSPYHSSIQYEWIEKLLETPIEDGRKYTLWKILCPYLVNVRKLEYEKSFEILKTWLEKCNKFRKLDFIPETVIRTKLRNVKHYNPISVEKLKDDNKNLYFLLKKLKISNNIFTFLVSTKFEKKCNR